MYPFNDADEGDWCECCAKVQPIRNGKCAVCGNGYDDCMAEDTCEHCLEPIEYCTCLWDEYIQDEQIEGDE